MTTQELLARARQARGAMALADTQTKDRALLAMAEELEADTAPILAANALDLEGARGRISEVMLDRLALSPDRIAGMAKGIREVAALPDPVGAVLSRVERPNGLVIEKTAVPMGVIAIIYESRPNVTSDAAALALKAGSACVLRCGKEAHRSAAAIVSALCRGLSRAGLPQEALCLVEDTTRASAHELMTASGYVDLLIPRGGAGLIRACVDNATVPVIETGTGICHVYVDRAADLDMALDILENAKCSRPSVCNAAEVCLVHREAAPVFLPRMRERLTDARAARGERPVELRLDGTEEAIRHIAAHSTGHSEAIVTEDGEAARRFLAAVDSAAVYWNASTRFTDGGEFGLGCEMGISTQKLHARGPLGLAELCSFKFVIRGGGQIR